MSVWSMKSDASKSEAADRLFLILERSRSTLVTSKGLAGGTSFSAATPISNNLARRIISNLIARTLGGAVDATPWRGELELVSLSTLL